MTPLLYFLVGILACSAIEEPQKSLKELEKILKHLAAQTALKNRGKSFQYLPHYSRPELVERSKDREEDDNNSAQSMEYYHQLDNVRIEKQLEDDLQQALMFESDRICKATGRCGCTRGRCGRSKTVDETVTEIEQLLDVLNKDLNKQRNRNFQSEEDRRQKDENRREKYGVEQSQYRNQRQQYKDRQQDHRLQEYDDRRQRQDDRREKLGNRRPEYNDRRQRQEDRRQRQDDRRQRQVDRRPDYDDRRQQKESNDARQEYEDRRQKQEEDDRRLELDDRRQEYQVRKQKSAEDDTDELIQNLRIASKNYKNAEFDFVILEVPESRELQNRANDIKIVDIRESSIKDLLEKLQTSHEENEEKEGRVGNLNLEDFVAYYEKIKEELTNSLLKYIKDLGDGSYLAQLLPYQKKQIEYLKKSQSKKPLADYDLKAKVVQLLFGSLSNIKILPHSNDDKTIYVPQQVVNAIPSFLKNKALRSSKRLLPLTLYQKQRQVKLAPKNLILKHSWRRNDQQQQNYGIPFNLQVQGLGQIN